MPLPLARAHSVVLAMLLAVVSLAGCQPRDAPGAAGARGQAGQSGGISASTQRWQARSLHVQDGDSFVVRTAGGSRRTIRLSGIDAPERDQPHASQSRQHLRRLIDGRELELRIGKTDPYGRAVAQVFVTGTDGEPVDVGLLQIEAGMAWYFRRFRRDLPDASRERYADAERDARNGSRGLWQASDPVAPWNFRRGQANPR